MKIKAMVKEVLEAIPETRDDDVLLTTEIWKRFFPEAIEQFDGKNGPDGYVRLTDLRKLPREDHVKRMRAHFQNDRGILLPTKIEVVRARKMNEERWLEQMRELAGGDSR